MSRRPAAEMPDSIRHLVRAKHHPARAVGCPHCQAVAHRPCTSPSKRRVMADPHPARVAAWVVSVACCPACQVEPGIPCHSSGWELPGSAVHPQRETEAAETA